MTDWQGVFGRLETLYREVDGDSRRLEKYHASRLKCAKGCTDCCVDDITVFEVEAEYIRHFGHDILAEEAHGNGKCAFLDDEGACRIYEWRPYVCRTQGLPLRWFDDDENGEQVEYRDICPLNEAGEPLEILPADACWEIGPIEGQLASLQAKVDNWALKRVALRDLFEKSEERGDG